MPQVGAIRLGELDTKGLPRGGGLLSELGSAVLAGSPPRQSGPRFTGYSGLRWEGAHCRPRSRWPRQPLSSCLRRAGWKLAFGGGPGVQSHAHDDQHSGFGRRRPLLRGRWFAARTSDFSSEDRLAAVKPRPLGDYSPDNPALHGTLPWRVFPAGLSGGVAFTLQTLTFLLQATSMMNISLLSHVMFLTTTVGY